MCISWHWTAGHCFITSSSNKHGLVAGWFEGAVLGSLQYQIEAWKAGYVWPRRGTGNVWKGKPTGRVLTLSLSLRKQPGLFLVYVWQALQRTRPSKGSCLPRRHAGLSASITTAEHVKLHVTAHCTVSVLMHLDNSPL